MTTRFVHRSALAVTDGGWDPHYWVDEGLKLPNPRA
jgi:hypothetical protein